MAVDKTTDQTFECPICTCDWPKSDGITVDVDTICIGCLNKSRLPRFIDAVKYEDNYPVWWGKAEVLPHSYPKHLPDGFLALWKMKVEEYGTEGEKRIYCKHFKSGAGNTSENCDLFLGSKELIAGQTMLCK